MALLLWWLIEFFDRYNCMLMWTKKLTIKSLKVIVLALALTLLGDNTWLMVHSELRANRNYALLSLKKALRFTIE